MIEINKDIASPDLLQKIKNIDDEIQEFRKTPLDKISLEKLREHFKTHHIYNSAAIEGNRLTLQETNLVLQEGIDISGKPLRDSIEIKQLGDAFDYLYELSKQEGPIKEYDIKQVHDIIIGHDGELDPGNYRDVGVVISGSEHTPPEPFEVPAKIEELFEWIKENNDKNPILIAALAHHEFVKIHPFKDGNGRTGRILLNLILLKKGYPICNIRKKERADYYEALSLADNGHYEPIIEIIAENSTRLFSEYTRVRDESNRLKDWALKLGNRDTKLRLSKSKTEFELWQNKISQVKLEFKQAVNILNEQVDSYYISFYEYPSITFEKYQQLKNKGIAPGTNFFSIRFHNKDTNQIIDTYMFRFYRSSNKYPNQKVIPLELNYYNPDKGEFDFIGYYKYSKKITLRSFYINKDGELITRYINPNNDNPNFEKDHSNVNTQDAVMKFIDEVFKNVLGVK